MVQLDLCIYKRGTLAEAIYWTLRNTCNHLKPDTLLDYQGRARWLLEQIPWDTDLRTVNFEFLVKLSNSFGPTSTGAAKLMRTTVRKKFAFLHKCMSEAHGREIIDRMPKFPCISNDGSARKKIHTQEQFEAMRAQLEEPAATWVTIAWYTGMHNYDVNRARENWFRLDLPYRSTSGHLVAPGQWLRHNHKSYGNDEDLVWLPMEEKFHDWLSARTTKGAPSDKIVGRLWKPAAKLAVACDRAEVPRVSPIDLRRSRATIMSAAGFSDEYIRVWLGHKGHGWTGPVGTGREDGAVPGRRPARPSVRTSHYYRPSVALIAGE